MVIASASMREWSRRTPSPAHVRTIALRSPREKVRQEWEIGLSACLSRAAKAAAHQTTGDRPRIVDEVESVRLPVWARQISRPVEKAVGRNARCELISTKFGRISEQTGGSHPLRAVVGSTQFTGWSPGWR